MCLIIAICRSKKIANTYNRGRVLCYFMGYAVNGILGNKKYRSGLQTCISEICLKSDIY